MSLEWFKKLSKQLWFQTTPHGNRGMGSYFFEVGKKGGGVFEGGVIRGKAVHVSHMCRMAYLTNKDGGSYLCGGIKTLKVGNKIKRG